MPVKIVRPMLREYYSSKDAKPMPDEKWAQKTGLYPETIAKLKKEIQKKKEEPSTEGEQSPEQKKMQERNASIIKRLRQGDEQTAIASDFGMNNSRVCRIASRNKIMSTKAVKPMLRKYYSSKDAKPISDEEWSKKTGLYPETIAKLKKEMQEEKEPSPAQKERQARKSRIIERLRQGDTQIAVALDSGMNRATICQIAAENGIMSVVTVRVMLKEYYSSKDAKPISDEEWAKKTGLYPEAIVKLKKEIEEKQARRQEKNANIIERLRQGDRQTAIAADFGISGSRVGQIADENGIMPVKTVKPMLREYYSSKDAKPISDEEWSKKTGLYPETIAKLKEEIQKKRKVQKKKEEPPTEERQDEPKKVEPLPPTGYVRQQPTSVNVPKAVRPTTSTKKKVRSQADFLSQFIQLAKNLTDPAIMKERLRISADQIRELRKNYKIYDRQQVVGLLNLYTDQEIASKGNLSVAAVTRVREQEAAKDTPQAREAQLIRQRAIAKKKREQEEPIFLTMAKSLEPMEKIRSTLGYTDYEIILLLRKHGITSREDVERMMESNPEISDAQIAARTDASKEKIAKIRAKVERRERLIRQVPEAKREDIIFMLIGGSNSSNFISYKTHVPEEQVKAIREKYERDKLLEPVQAKRQRALVILMNQIRILSKSQYAIVNQSNGGVIQQALALYPDLLGEKEYAAIAHAYLRIGNFLEGVEICKQYLGLTDTTVAGAMKKVIEVVERKTLEKREESLPMKPTPPTDVGGETR